MNKTELIEKVMANKPYRTRKGEVQEIIENTFAAVQGALAEGQEVVIQGFGRFSAAATKARKGRNPRTGAEVDIPAGHKIKFKPGKGMKEAVK